MLRSLIAKQLEAIPNIAKLVERLRTDPSFRYHCGFNAFGTVPSEATFSRFIAKLEKTGAIELLFEQTVAQGRADGIVGNEYVALDSTEIKAWEKPQPKGGSQLLTKKLLGGVAKEILAETKKPGLATKLILPATAKVNSLLPL